jgi:hypothetical protein
MSTTTESPELRIRRLETQNERLTALAEALVSTLVDHGVLSDEDRERLPVR